jgi:hypothetical protein
MAIENIRRRLRKYGTEHLLDALPLPEDLDWILHPLANPDTALVVGGSENSPVLAFLTRFGDKNREVHYVVMTPRASGSKHAAPTRAMTQDEVMRLPLVTPFKYLADQSKSMKRKFSMLIRWYFLSKGVINNIECEYDDFCMRFSQGLKKIDEEQRAARSGTRDEAPQRRDAIEESPDPDEETVYGLRSASRNGTAEKTHRASIEQETPSKRTPSRESKESNPDLRRLREYLDEYDSLHLLENIPNTDEMKFFAQTFFLDAQPKKLFMGHSKSGDDIYAYMVKLQRGFHAIRFYVESPRRKDAITAEDIAKQRILHPFSKTYPKHAAATDQSDRARLTLMVKWYFIAAGIATDCVLSETKAFPERLRFALEYIADRMGPGAVKQPKGLRNEDPSPDDDSTKQRTTSESSYVDESDIQSTLAGDPPVPSASPRPVPAKFVARKSAPSMIARKSTPLATPTEPGPPSRIPNGTSFIKTATPEATPTPRPAPRTAKRTAEDAEFADLARMITEEQKLTEQVNAIDHDLEVQEMRKEAFEEKQARERQAFMEKWERETSELNEKRDHIDSERISVRERFKKRKLSSSVDQ